jgi:hypothetical protein
MRSIGVVTLRVERLCLEIVEYWSVSPRDFFHAATLYKLCHLITLLVKLPRDLF